MEAQRFGMKIWALQDRGSAVYIKVHENRESA